MPRSTSRERGSHIELDVYDLTVILTEWAERARGMEITGFTVMSYNCEVVTVSYATMLVPVRHHLRPDRATFDHK